MPRIPGAQSRVSAGGSIRGGRLGPGDLPAGFTRAAGQVSEMLNRRRERQNALWREKTVAEARGTWAQRLTEMQQSAEPGAPAFTQTFGEQFDEWKQETLQQAPDRATRDELDADLTRLRSVYLGKAVAFEAESAANYQVSNVTDMLEANTNAVRADPTLLGEVEAQNRRAIENLSEINAAQREELLASQRNNVYWAAVNGHLGAIDTEEEARAFATELRESEDWRDGLDPQTYNKALAQADKLVDQLAAEGQEQFVVGLDEQVRELKHGVDNGLTPEVVRANIDDPELAERWAAEVAHARTIMGDVQRVEGASAAEVAGMVAEVRQDVATPGNFDDDTERLKSLSTAIEQRQTEYEADPAAYAIRVNPRVRGHYERLVREAQQGEASPEAVADYANAVRAEQRRLSGTDEFNLLPKQDLGRIAMDLGSIERTPEGAQRAYERIASLADSWGEYWPAVQRQLQEANVLTGSMAVAANMTRPEQRVAGQTLLRASFLGRKELAKQFEDPAFATEIERRTDTELAELYATLNPQRGGPEQARAYDEAVRTLATYYTATQGLNPSKAVERAADEVALSGYEFVGDYRIPATEPADPIIDGARNYLLTFEPPENALVPRSLIPGADDEAFAREQWRRYVQANGTWITNADESGLLLGVVEPNGEITTVETMGADGVPRPVTLTWDELAARAEPIRGGTMDPRTEGP